MTDDLCETCGVGFILPSGRCDHCDSVERHNAWVETLKADVEWTPLREFLDRLKEPAPAEGGEK